jgi:hypothetical protein
MMDQLCVGSIAFVMVMVFLAHLLRREFDAFAPHWLFLAGFAQVYVVQALAFRDWALRTRGPDVVTDASVRALWAILWFLLVYHLGFGRALARALPRPPASWSAAAVGMLSPVLIVWGLICAGILLRLGSFTSDPTAAQVSDEESLFRSFPMVMLVGSILLIVTGRQPDHPRPTYLAAGLLGCAAYVVIWMYNGKRSHSLVGVLTGACAYYVPRFRRPSWPVLTLMGFVCTLVVAIAIGWRGNAHYERTFSGFLEFVGDFRPAALLEGMNIKDKEGEVRKTYETEEYGGYLLMLDTVPAKSGFDYGAPYLRIFSTFIPRIIWKDKPVFGREQWINAWIAGSELPRDSTFTGPAIGILGATQLNGGATATVIVLGLIALTMRTCYEYFRLYADHAWVQAWWSLLYFNAWFMTVTDDPLNWFYYNWGFTTMPFLAFLWIFNRVATRPGQAPVPRFA